MKHHVFTVPLPIAIQSQLKKLMRVHFAHNFNIDNCLGFCYFFCESFFLFVFVHSIISNIGGQQPEFRPSNATFLSFEFSFNR